MILNLSLLSCRLELTKIIREQLLKLKKKLMKIKIISHVRILIHLKLNYIEAVTPEDFEKLDMQNLNLFGVPIVDPNAEQD